MDLTFSNSSYSSSYRYNNLTYFYSLNDYEQYSKNIKKKQNRVFKIKKFCSLLEIKNIWNSLLFFLEIIFIIIALNIKLLEFYFYYIF